MPGFDRARILARPGRWHSVGVRSLELARTNDVPVWVAGVGTLVGDFIP